MKIVSAFATQSEAENESGCACYSDIVSDGVTLNAEPRVGRRPHQSIGRFRVGFVRGPALGNALTG